MKDLEIIEYRGVENLVYAKLLTDTAEGMTFGEVNPIAGIAEVSKATESSSDVHYYDNYGAIVIDSEGPDTITLNVSAIPLEVLADITGQYYDESTGMLCEGDCVPPYIAIGYITENTNHEKMLVWRLKGKVSIPDQTSLTKNNGTDANGQELVYTGINPNCKFTKTGRHNKGIIVNAGKGLIDDTNFFTSVQTPDTVNASQMSIALNVTLSEMNVEGYIGDEKTLTAVVNPPAASVTWQSSDNAVASVTNGTVTMLTAGTATITASITDGTNTYTATCSVTVSTPQLYFGTSPTLQTSFTVSVGQEIDASRSLHTLPDGQDVIYSSSDNDVFTVDANGVITGVADGTGTITAKMTYNGTEYTTSTDVTVE